MRELDIGGEIEGKECGERERERMKDRGIREGCQTHNYNTGTMST